MRNQISHMPLTWINCENQILSFRKSWTSEQQNKEKFNGKKEYISLIKTNYNN